MSCRKLPAIFICENNLYGEYSPIATTTPIERLADRASSYGIEGVRIDGMDTGLVHETVAAAVARARAGEGPAFIEAMTYRYKGHSRSDPGAYRPDGELEAWARFMARMTAPGGEATMIHKADALARVLAVFEARFGALKILPLHSRQGTPAHRVLVQGVKGSRGPLQLLPGFVLHGEGNAFTPAAQEILRAAAPLPMAAAG